MMKKIVSNLLAFVGLMLMAVPAFAQTSTGSGIIAIGAATAALLEEKGIVPDIVPQQATSEGLMQDGRLGEMPGRRVLIIRGEGGREHLAEALKNAGAEVTYAEVYRRVQPPPPSRTLLREWEQRVDVMIVTSETMLNNLLTLTGGAPAVMQTPLIVISERLQASAVKLGFSGISVAASPYNSALLKALCKYQ